MYLLKYSCSLVVNGVRYLETGEETNTIGIFFRFDEAEANGITIREYGLFLLLVQLRIQQIPVLMVADTFIVFGGIKCIS
jgi:hypothetical protein